MLERRGRAPLPSGLGLEAAARGAPLGDPGAWGVGGRGWRALSAVGRRGAAVGLLMRGVPSTRVRPTTPPRLPFEAGGLGPAGRPRRRAPADAALGAAYDAA